MVARGVMVHDHKVPGRAACGSWCSDVGVGGRVAWACHDRSSCARYGGRWAEDIGAHGSLRHVRRRVGGGGARGCVWAARGGARGRT
jgi:hypothetical protein